MKRTRITLAATALLVTTLAIACNKTGDTSRITVHRLHWLQLQPWHPQHHTLQPLAQLRLRSRWHRRGHRHRGQHHHHKRIRARRPHSRLHLLYRQLVPDCQPAPRHLYLGVPQLVSRALPRHHHRLTQDDAGTSSPTPVPCLSAIRHRASPNCTHDPLGPFNPGSMLSAYSLVFHYHIE